MYPLEIQLQIFETLARDPTTHLHTLQHVLYASPHLLSRITKHHMNLLTPFVIAELGAGDLNIFIARVLISHPNVVSSSKRVNVTVDWWKMVELMQTDSLCGRCFSYGGAVKVSAGSCEGDDVPQVWVTSGLLNQVDWVKSWALCPPCCYRPLNRSGKKAQSSVRLAEPITEDCLKPLPQPADTTSNSTSAVVQEWRERMAAKRRQRTLAQQEQQATRRRWSGGGISGWSFGMEDEIDEDSDGSDGEFDWTEVLESNNELHKEEPIPIAAMARESNSIASPKSELPSTSLSRKCDGCTQRFCTTCINSVNACPTCNAQLCLGCFPPPLHFPDETFFASGLVNLFVDVPLKMDGKTPEGKLWNIYSISERSISIGRTLTCSSCGAIACAGCGDLEDWALQVSGYGGRSSARREQDFQCLECRECRNPRNHDDFSSWF